MRSRELQQLTVESEDQRALGFAEPDRVLGQRLEDRLEIERGPPDHLEELAGRRLLLEGDPQLAVARLQFGEQADVLDGDDGLVGEGLQQLDVSRRERPPLRSLDDDDPRRRPVGSQHGHGEQACQVGRPGHALQVVRVIRYVQDLFEQRG